MKKGCLIAIVGVVGFFVLLTIIGVVASLFVSDSEQIAEREKPNPAAESAKAERAKSSEPESTSKSFSDLYSIISDKPSGTVKRSVDVRLKEKVSEETLEGIAKEIHDANPKDFERTFIVYYLPEQIVGAGGWATSHFNPTLEINILGLAKGSEAETAGGVKAGETEIGRWEYSAPPGFIVIALNSEKGVTIRRVFADGSSLDEETQATFKADEIVLTPVELNEAGDHWILDGDGNLRLMDNEGLIGKAVFSGETKGTDHWKEVFGLVEKAKEPTEKIPTIFDARTWTSADGQRTFFGTLTKLGDGELTVEKDGEPITFAIEKLSPADREFLGQGVSITTLDGTTHENGSVARISAESILFKKDSGPVQIAMENLPEEIRRRFGYDPEIAAKMKEAREKQAVALRERQAAAAAQQTAQDKLDSFMTVLKAAGVTSDLITEVSTKGETISITVANGWHYQPKQVRQQSAQILWQTWAIIYAPNDLDKARLSLRDSVGNEVGGSRWLAGSLIWVDD